MGSEVGESNWSRVAYVVHSIPFLHTYVRACLVAIVFQCVVECTYVRTYYARRLVRGFKADSSLRSSFMLLSRHYRKRRCAATHHTATASINVVLHKLLLSL